VLAIGGYEWWNGTLSTVSFYNIANNTWKGGLPQLIRARNRASACLLDSTVYVFCGFNNYERTYLNSIEMISETFLVP